MKTYRQLTLRDTGGAVTENDLADFEERFCVSLPNGFRTFLLSVNGGMVMGEISTQIGELSVNQLYSLKYSEIAHDSELAFNFVVEDLPCGLRPIGRDHYGNPICINFKDNLGNIFLYETDLNESYFMGTSFDEFVDAIQLEDHLQ